MEHIEGYVDHIVFRNSENGYTVLTAVCGGEELTCVGNLNYIGDGEAFEADGRYTEHATYGRQFVIESFRIKMPEDAVSVERYLGSGAIKGIGTALAARIVRHFGDDTLRIMEEEPERLAEIKGISDKKAREIAEQMQEKQDVRKAMLFLQQYGIGAALGAKIYSFYGQALYGIVKENPYKMADDIDGVGFRIADEIAARAGIHTDSEFRIRCGILYVLQQAALSGHIYLPDRVLLGRAVELLNVSGEDVEKHMMDLAVDRRLVIKQSTDVCVYSAQSYYLELNTAKMLHDLNIHCEIVESAVRDSLEKIEERLHAELDELQKKAAVMAAGNGLVIITGGPGTGKTTTINALITYFESEGMSVRLAAPTGRAARRMTETTGHEAQTIHRMLEISAGSDDAAARGEFGRNAQNPLEEDVIIVDEMSMVDIYLMYALLCAVVPGTRLILVGDVNQLPSVGPGCVLKDMIDSGAFPVVRLTKIFRQAAESDIIVNAHKINAGEHVRLDNKSRDFFFLPRDSADVIISHTLELIQKRLPKYVKARPEDIQVLTPMRKGLLGVERLNTVLQQYLNPPSEKKREREYGGGVFREGDKVMQIKNNYQIEWEVRGRYGIAVEKGTGIFNGDMGIIREINTFAERLTVEFDDSRFVEYPFRQLDELELSYAVTIHKSQGSEYPAVVIPLLSGPRMLMNRNLLYTAVTRARTCVTIVGSPEVFDQMIDNASMQRRYTTLKQRIQELLPGEGGDDGYPENGRMEDFLPE